MYRVGLLVHSSNTTMEREFNSILTGAATVHSARIKLGLIEVVELNELAAGLLEEADKLASAEVDVIVYGCTSGSFIKGSKQYEEIEKSVEKHFGIPCVATAGAVVRALQKLNVRKTSLITPYVEEITKKEAEFLRFHGIKTVNMFYASITKNTEVGKIKDEEVVNWVINHVDDNAESVFISCTNLSTFKTIKQLEETLQKPVISSNSATLWNVLQKLQLKLDIQLGKLFKG